MKKFEYTDEQFQKFFDISNISDDTRRILDSFIKATIGDPRTQISREGAIELHYTPLGTVFGIKNMKIDYSKGEITFKAKVAGDVIAAREYMQQLVNISLPEKYRGMDLQALNARASRNALSKEEMLDIFNKTS